MFTKNQWLVVFFSIWALVALSVLVLLKSLDYQYFFVLCLIGFLILVELSGPFMTKPAWKRRVNIIIAIGVVLFAFIVYSKVMEIIR